MLEPYTPYEVFPKSDPVFERERKLLEAAHNQQAGSFTGDIETAVLIGGFVLISLIIGIKAA